MFGYMAKMGLNWVDSPWTRYRLEPCMNCLVMQKLICDSGHHVDQRPVIFCSNKRDWKYRPYHRLIWQLVAWKMECACWEEFPVVIANGTARLKSTGNLAGYHKLKDGLKNVVEWALRITWQSDGQPQPAKSVHIDDVCGPNPLKVTTPTSY